MPKVLVDVTPLRQSREFRLLYFGQIISYLGSQMTVVAAPYQIYVLTHSSLMVGLLGLAAVGPLIAGSLIGGALADAYDRRKLLLVAQVLLGSASVGLAVNAMLPSPKVWLIYVLVVAQQAFAGLDSPTRSAATPKLVGAQHLPAAAALNQLLYQLGVVVGPALGGLLIAKVSLASAYWVDAVSFGFAIVALLAMKPMRPDGGGTRASAASVVEGLRFLKGRQALQGTFVIDINAMVFGMPRALFPAIGTSLGGPAVVGLLYAAPGVGALVGRGHLRLGEPGRSPGPGHHHRGHRLGCVHRRLRAEPLAAPGPGDVGRGRRRGRDLRRVPQHHPPAQRARSAAGSTVVGAHRGGHRRAPPG